MAVSLGNRVYTVYDELLTLELEMSCLIESLEDEYDCVFDKYETARNISVDSLKEEIKAVHSFLTSAQLKTFAVSEESVRSFLTFPISTFEKQTSHLWNVGVTSVVDESQIGTLESSDSPFDSIECNFRIKLRTGFLNDVYIFFKMTPGVRNELGEDIIKKKEILDARKRSHTKLKTAIKNVRQYISLRENIRGIEGGTDTVILTSAAVANINACYKHVKKEQ